MPAPTNGFETLHKHPIEHTLTTADTTPGTNRVRSVMSPAPGYQYVYVQTDYLWTCIALLHGHVVATGYGTRQGDAKAEMFAGMDRISGPGPR